MKQTILVVDDDAMNLRMAEMILKKKDYDIKKADSGQAALELLKEESVDLVLLDVEMPGMNGIETLSEIRANWEAEKLPVMFLSASEDMEQDVENGKYAVQGFIKKPIMMQEVHERVSALFE